MKDIMLDLETMGTGNNAMIASIGAVKFDLNTGETGEEFYCTVNLESCDKYGLRADGGSIKFWMEQPDEARKALFDPKPISLPDALSKFKEFYGDFRKSNVWGNGALFDNVIMRNAFTAVNKMIPWGYKNDRDVRTLVQLGKLSGLQKQQVDREGVHHNALDDPKHQVKYCHYIWKWVSAVPELSKGTPDSLARAMELMT